MVKQKSLKGAKDQPDDPVYNMDKFFGEGVMFKCKLFGSLKIAGPRGDELCAEAMAQLKQQAKQLNKEQKMHKQRIFFNISLKGIRIIDQQSRKLEHAHVVHKVSYISHDKEDRRTFAYVVSLPEGYHLFAFKAEKNAGVITSSLKELFHVVYLKHKQEREKQENVDANPDAVTQNDANSMSAAETGQEPNGEDDENPYAVPMKFQLFEENFDDANPYDVPTSRPAFESENIRTGDMGSTENDAANLLDWTDVNDELEILHKDLKRSDTKQLLAELGDFDLDANPPRQPEGQSVFMDDPFFKASTSSSTDFSNGNTAAFSPGIGEGKTDPFFPSSDDLSTKASNSSTNGNNGTDFGLFGNDQVFAPAQPSNGPAKQPQPFSSGVDDLFSSVSTQGQTSIQFDNNWSASTSNTGSSQQFPALQPANNDNSLFTTFDQTPAVELVPEKLSEPKADNGDPFAALSGGISDIRGTLPAASGSNVPQFPKKTKPAFTSESSRVVSPGPSIQPGSSIHMGRGQSVTAGFGQQPYQGTSSISFSQSNPFSQTGSQYSNSGGYSARMNVPPIPSRSDMPLIPPRQDLMQSGGFQPVQQPMMQQPMQQQPMMQQPMQQQPMMQQPMQQQQQFAPPVPKPFVHSRHEQGGLLRSNPTSPTPPQVSADPFADLGGTFSMNQSAATQEPLYAVVDKSQKINPNVNQESSDLFGIFDGNTSATEASSGTLATSTSEQDPFGFGF